MTSYSNDLSPPKSLSVSPGRGATTLSPDPDYQGPLSAVVPKALVPVSGSKKSNLLDALREEFGSEPLPSVLAERERKEKLREAERALGLGGPKRGSTKELFDEVAELEDQLRTAILSGNKAAVYRLQREVSEMRRELNHSMNEHIEMRLALEAERSRLRKVKEAKERGGGGDDEATEGDPAVRLALVRNQKLLDALVKRDISKETLIEWLKLPPQEALDRLGAYYKDGQHIKHRREVKAKELRGEGESEVAHGVDADGKALATSKSPEEMAALLSGAALGPEVAAFMDAAEAMRKRQHQRRGSDPLANRGEGDPFAKDLNSSIRGLSGLDGVGKDHVPILPTRGGTPPLSKKEKAEQTEKAIKSILKAKKSSDALEAGRSVAGANPVGVAGPSGNSTAGPRTMTLHGKHPFTAAMVKQAVRWFGVVDSVVITDAEGKPIRKLNQDPKLQGEAEGTAQEAIGTGAAGSLAVEVEVRGTNAIITFQKLSKTGAKLKTVMIDGVQVEVVKIEGGEDEKGSKLTKKKSRSSNGKRSKGSRKGAGGGPRSPKQRSDKVLETVSDSESDTSDEEEGQPPLSQSNVKLPSFKSIHSAVLPLSGSQSSNTPLKKSQLLRQSAAELTQRHLEKMLANRKSLINYPPIPPPVFRGPAGPMPALFNPKAERQGVQVYPVPLQSSTSGQHLTPHQQEMLSALKKREELERRRRLEAEERGSLTARQALSLKVVRDSAPHTARSLASVNDAQTYAPSGQSPSGDRGESENDVLNPSRFPQQLRRSSPAGAGRVGSAREREENSAKGHRHLYSGAMNDPFPSPQRPRKTGYEMLPVSDELLNAGAAPMKWTVHPPNSPRGPWAFSAGAHAVGSFARLGPMQTTTPTAETLLPEDVLSSRRLAPNKPTFSKKGAPTLTGRAR
jgi:hypothetical protein